MCLYVCVRAEGDYLVFLFGAVVLVNWAGWLWWRCDGNKGNIGLDMGMRQALPHNYTTWLIGAEQGT